MLPVPTNERQRAWESSSRAIQDPSNPANLGPFPLGEKLLTSSVNVEVIRSGKCEGLQSIITDNVSAEQLYNQWKSGILTSRSASDVPGFATT